MSTAPANRGKVAESLVKNELEKLTRFSNFDYERILDAYSSRGGSTVSRPGDFMAWQKGRCTLLEVKEVNHEFRLPRANFKRDQRARMTKRALAGCHCVVLVYFTPVKIWRAFRIDYFGSDDKGSWNMSDAESGTLSAIFKTLFEYDNLNLPS